MSCKKNSEHQWICKQDIKERRDEDLLVLPTDAALFDDPSFKVKKIKNYLINFEFVYVKVKMIWFSGICWEICRRWKSIFWWLCWSTC